MTTPEDARREALRWAADVVHSEARWQWELHTRGTVGAQIVAQRMTVVEQVLRSAIEPTAPPPEPKPLLPLDRDPAAVAARASVPSNEETSDV